MSIRRASSSQRHWASESIQRPTGPSLVKVKSSTGRFVSFLTLRSEGCCSWVAHLCVCLLVNISRLLRLFILKMLSHSVDNEGENNQRDFSETALLQRFSTSYIVWLSVQSTIFTSRKMCMRITSPRFVLSCLHILSAARVFSCRS